MRIISNAPVECCRVKRRQKSAVSAAVEYVPDRISWAHIMSDHKNAACNVVASCATGASVIAITNPLDCLKQRWQLSSTSSQKFPAFVSEILRTEGLFRGLWLHGLATNCLACTLSVGCRMGLYPILRDALSPSGIASPAAMFASGLAGGALGYVAAAPFFFASRVAQAEAGLLVDGVLATGAR